MIASKALGLRSSTLIGVVVLLLACSAPAHADAPERERHIGIAAGYVHGFDEFRSGVDEGHEFRGLTLLPHWQAAFGPHLGAGSGASGRIAFRAEGTLILGFEPRSGVAGGIGLLFRYEFDHWDRGDAGVIPYLQLGGGFLGIDLDIEDQADGFAVQPQVGAGLRQRASRRISVDYGIRYHHISNMFTRSPNGGIDTVQLVVGFAWRRD